MCLPCMQMSSQLLHKKGVLSSTHNSLQLPDNLETLMSGTSSSKSGSLSMQEDAQHVTISQACDHNQSSTVNTHHLKYVAIKSHSGATEQLMLIVVY